MNITVISMRELRRAFAATAIFALVLLSAQGIFAQTARAAEAANIDQAQNGKASSPEDPVKWVNGAVNEQKGHYVEGDSIPYRMVMTGLTPNVPNTLIVEFDVLKAQGTKKKFAIDYITSDDRIAETVDPCDGITPCSGPNTFNIPAPAYSGAINGYGFQDVTDSFNALVGDEGTQVAKIWNGSFTNVAYTLSPDLSTQDSARVTFSFVPTTTTAVISWGGHISTSLDYPGESAITISGSPYHTRLISLNGDGGNQDMALSASAVQFPGNLLVIKHVDNTGGGTKTADQFTINVTVNTNGETATPDSFSGDESGTLVSITTPKNGTSTYSVAEVTDPSYSVSYSPDCTGGVMELQQKVCTITNTYIPPTADLTLVKEVVNQFGTPASSSEWTLHADGSTDIDGTTGVSDTVTPGTFVLSETGGPTIDPDVGSYELTSISCDGGTQDDDEITLSNGDNVTCTFTNTFVPADSAMLHVVKVLDQDNGGDEDYSDFTFVFDGVEYNWDQGNDTKTIIIPQSDLGSYSVTEVEDELPVLGRYTVGYNNCSDLDLSFDGAEETCTITNSDIAPELTIIKSVDNTSQTKDNIPGDFTMVVTADNPSNNNFDGSDTGVTITLDAGDYSVDEADDLGYNKSFEGECSGTIDLGEEKTCTIKNTAPDPTVATINFIKQMEGQASIPQGLTFTVGGDADESGIVSGGSLELGVGDYTVSETDIEWYEFVSNNDFCTDGEFEITQEMLGNEYDCIFTNREIPRSSITIDKVTTGYKANDNLAFSFNVSGNMASSFLLSGSGAPKVFNNLPAGNFTFTETDGGARWELIDITCTGLPEGRSLEDLGNGKVTVQLAEGENVTCTFTNEYTDDFQTDDEYIVVRKEVTQGSDTSTLFDFEFVSYEDDATSSFQLSDGLEWESEELTANEWYGISEENIPDYWSLEDVTCTSDQDDDQINPQEFLLEDGEVITCVFTNDQELFEIFGYVWNDANENGDWDEGEDPLENWTVRANANGQSERSTTSDAEGYYHFFVPAGTWTLSEDVKGGWDQTFPVANSGTHIVVVPQFEAFNDEEENIFTSIFSFFVPTAMAQVPTPQSYGEYNFGNVEDRGGGGGGGSRSPICQDFTISSATFQSGDELTLSWDTAYGDELSITANGVEIFFTDNDSIVDGDTLAVFPTEDTEYELTVSNGSKDDTCRVETTAGPTPQVLGEQVSAVPLGAANTGAGGTAPIELPHAPFVAAFLATRRK